MKQSQMELADALQESERWQREQQATLVCLNVRIIYVELGNPVIALRVKIAVAWGEPVTTLGLTLDVGATNETGY